MSMENHYSVKQFADKVGLTAQGVHALIKAGTIKAERIGTFYAIPKDELSKAQSRKKPGRPRGK